MKRTYTVGTLLTVCVLLSTGSTSLDAQHVPSGSALRIVQSGAQEMVLALTVKAFHTQTVEYDGHVYQQLLIPGMALMARPGEPQVPTRGTLLGIPSLAGVAVQVLEAVYETLQGYRLAPAPALQGQGDTLETLVAGGVQPTVAVNHTRYTTDAWYPGLPVEIGSTGYMRDQAVAQVQFYPVHYNPVTGEVRLYRRIQARISWETPRAAAPAAVRSALSPAYERVLQHTLLNYPALGRSALTSRPPPERATAIKESATSRAMPALKIGVTTNGLYALTSSDLAEAGFNPRLIDPRVLTLRNRGREIPLYVPGEDDGVFDPSDVLLFYGTAITDMYTTTNVYWLTVGDTPGPRLRTRNGRLMGRATTPTHFPVMRRAERNTYYWQTMPNGRGHDHWFWDDKLTAPATRAHPLRLSHLSPTARTATVRVRLQGRTDDLRANPDHHTRIALNGTEIDEQLWNGQRAYTHRATVPHALLNEGNNVITVEAVGDTGAVVDQVFVNWIEIGYWAPYVAKNNALLFGAPAAGTFQFTVTGFRSDDITVFDVTHPTDVVLLTHTTLVPDGGTYTLQFEDTAQPETRYLALTAAQYKSPASLRRDRPSSWRTPNHGADYIIITHEKFYRSALALAAHRRAGGLRVVTVNIEDIYDEFNAGIFHPRAIRRFLSYAYHNWRGPAPTYVLLMGDAAQDYKNNLRTGTRNYVPSQVIETEILGETPSDNWFVTVSGDDVLPDMFIGRLPVQTVAEARAVVNKILRYENRPPANPWNSHVLLVADDESPAFEDMAEQLAARLPAGYVTTKVYAGDYPPGDPTTDIIHALNSGSVLVTYTGHGSVDMWGLGNGSDPLLTRADITALANTHRLPVVTVANCLNGFFVGPQPQISVAEAFLRLPQRGAVAVWAPTGLSFPSDQLVLMRALYEAIFRERQFALGAATTAAKLAAFAQNRHVGELVETYVLFGDPALHVGISLGHAPQVALPLPKGRALDTRALTTRGDRE